MPLNHGVTISYPSVSGVATVGATEPIAVVGVAQSGSAVPGTLYLINSSSEASAVFGTHATGDTIPRTLEILQRYGCTNIIGLEVAKGVDDATTITSIITALDTLLTSRTTLGLIPRIILVPGFNTTALIDKALTIAESLKAISIFQFATTETTSTVTTARNGATGMGLKNPRLVTCFPSLKNAVTPSIIEPLASHVAGAIAWQKATKGLAGGIDNFPLEGVSGTDIAFTTSWDDETADSEKMFDLGVETVNSRNGEWVIWGDRNASYPIDISATSRISGLRVRDSVAAELYAIAQPWIGQPGEIGYALSLEAQMQAYLNSLMTGENAALSLGMVDLSPSESNFSSSLGQIKWVYSITLRPLGGVEIINLTVEVK